MPSLKCRCGRDIVIDEVDYLFIKDFIISCDKDGNLQVWFNKGTQAIAFGNLIIGPTPTGKELDHKDRNTHNNKRNNLRFCTHAENCCNRGISMKNTSSMKGVSRFKERWQVRIQVGGQRISLGYFNNVEDAGRAYNKAALHYHGEFAVLNDLTKLPTFIGPQKEVM